MKFVLMIYQGTTPLPGTERWAALSEAEQQAIYADYRAVSQLPEVTPGLPLGTAAVARTVRVEAGRPVVASGPHLTEAVGGYLVVDAPDVEAAIAIAARVPAARLGGAVEVRPAEVYW